MGTDRQAQLAAIGALQDPVRRGLYDYVVSARAEVSRDQAAEAVGVSRSLAAFHLDRLVDAGLLEASFRRLTGRSGPGAGRPAKLYRRSPSEHAVALPPRHYDLAADLLAQAVEEAGDRPARPALADVARRFGRSLGADLRGRLGRRAGQERRLSALVEQLEDHGYEPRREGPEVRLGNCPFHALAGRHRELVCGMNLALLEGFVEAAGQPGLEARPDPRPGECCVALAVTGREA